MLRVREELGRHKELHRLEHFRQQGIQEHGAISSDIVMPLQMLELTCWTLLGRRQKPRESLVKQVQAMPYRFQA